MDQAERGKPNRRRRVKVICPKSRPAVTESYARRRARRVAESRGLKIIGEPTVELLPNPEAMWDASAPSERYIITLEVAEEHSRR